MTLIVRDFNFQPHHEDCFVLDVLQWMLAPSWLTMGSESVEKEIRIYHKQLEFHKLECQNRVSQIRVSKNGTLLNISQIVVKH